MKQAHADCICCAFILCACPILWWEMRDVPWEGQVFPFALIVLLALCAIALGVRGTLRLRANTGDAFRFFGDVSPYKWLVIVMCFSAYVLLAMNVSFLYATLVFATGLPLFLEKGFRLRQFFVAAAFSCCLTLFFYLFFVKLMHINFPSF